ncbi:3'-5' exonuclease-like [Phragmites australis]|uniref:3'-5' exonuclease-like n=1 Tax=Phragmites australis TaxID=29695 RepID=UPI002D79196D|nr:3'-5' exonuclease-like [Phragmites australis]
MAETDVMDVTFGDYVITTTVTSSGAAVEDWLVEVRSVHRLHLLNLVIGLDVEWRPSTRAAQNPVATLQLCVGRRCLIFQLLHADYIPGALTDFLGDPVFRFVGVGVEADAERLSEDHDLKVANAVDLRVVAAEGMHRPELRQAGLRAIVAAVMGVSIVKPQRVTMSRWDAHCLSYEQIRYACIDAFVSFEVGYKLLTGDY